MDKGCLIFNTNKAGGYKIAVIDHSNRAEAVYMVDNFLQLRVSNDDYTKTNSTLNMYKSFVTEKLNKEFELSKAYKIDLPNRSVRYFKEKMNLI